MALDTSGNVKVDFVWGPFPMQPDDERTGSATQFGGEDGDYGWSATTMVKSTALNKALSFHSIAENNWNGYPDYTPVAPYLDTTDQAAIPNVVGALEAAATSTLTTAGFVKGAVTTTGVGATTVNDGKVKTQTPAATTVANLGTAVALRKYLAPTVPNVLGMTESEANDELVAVGLVKGAVTTDGVGATVANDGTVKSQTPVSGGKADTGSAVALVKYLAPTVPDVTGDDEATAEAALIAAGLVKGTVTTSADGATAENDGTVKSQSPVGGGKADTGSAVNLVLYAFAG